MGSPSAVPASVSLHPVASRNGQQSSTVVQVQMDPSQSSGASPGPAQHHLVHLSQQNSNSPENQDVVIEPASSALPGRPALHRSPHSSGPAAPLTEHSAAAPPSSEAAHRPSVAQRAAFALVSTTLADSATTGDAASSSSSDAGTEAAGAFDGITSNRFGSARAKPEIPLWGLQHPDLSIYPVVRSDGTSSPTQEEVLRQQASTLTHRSRAASTASAPPTALHNWSQHGEPIDDPHPLRRMSAAQFANLYHEYAQTDVPHAVVFPFLHGVDGDNYEQNIFFGAPLSGMPTPKYRGLTIVRANMPTAQQRLLSRTRQASRVRSFSQYSYSLRNRADSVATDASDIWPRPPSAGSSSDDHASADRTTPAPLPISNVSSSHSISSQGTSIFSHRSGCANASVGSMTSVGSSSTTTGEDGFFTDVQKPGRFSGSQQMLLRPYEAQPPHSLLISSVFPGELLSVPVSQRTNKRDSSSRPGSRGATFLKPRQADGVSLRNFKIQCAKYATISDIVIYCPAGLHEGMLELGQWFKEAQDAKWEERKAKGLGGLRYNVFLVEDPFEAFEEHFPELVAVDSNGGSANRVDFADREREEMQRLSKASEIDANVWLGSSADVPQTDMPTYFKEAGIADDCVSAQLQRELLALNPHGFSVCIEAHESGEMPSMARLTHASSYLDSVEQSIRQDIQNEQAQTLAPPSVGDDIMLLDKSRPTLSLGPKGWTPPLRRFSQRARGKWNGGSSPMRSTSDIREVEPVKEPVILPPESMVLLSCSTYRDTHQYNPSMEEALADQTIDMALWIKSQAEPTSQLAMRFHRTLGKGEEGATQPPRRFLLHCGDGYTETSVLALTYIMLSRRLSLPDAYLYLQNEANRSFFVYARELAFLRKVEARLAERIPHFERGRASAQQQGGDEASLTSDEEMEPSSSSTDRGSSGSGSNWSRSLVAAASGIVSSIPSAGSHRRQTSNGTSAPSSTKLGGDESPSSRVKTPTPASPQLVASTLRLSPEEKHPWFYSRHFEGSFPSRILPFLYLGNLNHALNAPMLHALGITHVVSVGESALSPPAGHALSSSSLSSSDASSNSAPMGTSLWHEERAGRINVLDLKNVSDDGIDPLRSAMKQAVEYMENCRRSGGKVLVHCRVGVSRSSTIVIAYVMAHLDMSFIESYLLVRSRRLNILIQPHLLFCFNLLSWQNFLTKVKDARRLAQGTAARSTLQDVDMRDLSLSRDAVHTSRKDSVEARHMSDVLIEAYENDLDVDIGAGAGSAHSIPLGDVKTLPFGSGSPTGLPGISTRLTWGFLAREIAQLNEKYFVSY